MTVPNGAAAGIGFQLDAAPLLSRSTVDRREMLRDSPESAAQLWRNGYVLPVDGSGRAPVHERADDSLALAHRPAAEFGTEPPAGAVLLGAEGDVSYWAMRAGEEEPTSDRRSLRAAGALLTDNEAGLLATAVGLLAWHRRAIYCTVCGARTRPDRAGWVRICSGCAREEYPRTDPAVICLVHDGADRVLLARQPAWPAERYSVLAGFVEVGESLESCVQREILEEVGVPVDRVRYLGSQPWPFPRSLMLGFSAIADPDVPLQPADGEIEDARWVHRDTVRTALRDGQDAATGLCLPPGVSIAYRMVRGWAFEAG